MNIWNMYDGCKQAHTHPHHLLLPRPRMSPHLLLPPFTLGPTYSLSLNLHFVILENTFISLITQVFISILYCFLVVNDILTQDFPNMTLLKSGISWFWGRQDTWQDVPQLSSATCQLHLSPRRWQCSSVSSIAKSSKVEKKDKIFLQ